ncbi:unnamed protein product, partial [Rotaria sordida]
MFKNQISSLIIGTKNRLGVSRDVNTLIFTNIFSVFNNLKYFNFDPSSICYQTILFKNSSSPIFSSTTLLELHVKVDAIGDCLYLLDGRFNQLRSFHVHILMPFRYSMLQLNT